MDTRKWLALVVAVIFIVPGAAALADNHDHGNNHGNAHGNGHYLDKKKDHDDDDNDRRGYGFAARDRDQIRAWYAENSKHLPPGLAEKDRLPPDLERQLVIHSPLPLSLEVRVRPMPVVLERRLPPPPRDCQRVIIGGHIVLRDRKTNIVLNIFHFE